MLSLAIQILTISILGRLLDPGDFGTVAMVTAIVGVGELVRDFGLGTAAVQAPTLSHGERSNLFWLNTLIGGAMGLLFFVFADAVARFYEQPNLTIITQVLALTFLLNGLATQPRANLIRDMRQRAVAMGETLSAIIALIVGISMAFYGLGFWAIVGMQLSRATTRMLLTFALSGFVPALPSRQVAIGPFLRFGVGLLGAKTLNYVSKNVDNVLIGRSLGAVPLGFYSRAYQLAFMPISQLSEPLSRVAFPTLSKLHDDDQKFSVFLTRAQSMLLLVAATGYTVAVVYADVIIYLALGSGWESSVPIFRILSIAGVFEAAHQVTYWMFVSKGNTARHFQFALLTRPILIIAILIAVPYGLIEVAFAFLAWIIVAWPIGLYWACIGTHVSASDVFRRACRIILSAALVGAVAAFTRFLVQKQGLTLEVAASGLAMLLSAGMVTVLSTPVRSDVYNALGAIKSMLPTKIDVVRLENPR